MEHIIWRKFKKHLIDWKKLFGLFSIMDEAPEEEQNFATLLEFINASETREDDETFNGNRL